VPFLFCETNLHGADGMGVDIGLAPSWKGTLYGTPLMATLVVEAAFCNEPVTRGALSFSSASEANYVTLTLTSDPLHS
jgi:hypothetical protein